MITGIIIGIVAFIAVICSFAWYRIVDPSEAHLVVTSTGKFVASPDEDVGDTKWYFAIPAVIPFFGRKVRVMDVTIKETKIEQETIEKEQARYNVASSTKYRISDVKTAADKFIDDHNLKLQLEEIIKSSVRAVTVRYGVAEARAKKSIVSDEIEKEMKDDLAEYGLTLITFQLVDFKDTKDSSIITDISLREESKIDAATRKIVAERDQEAKIVEAEADEKAKTREIARDQVVAEKEQLKAQKIAEMEKTAEEKRFKVVEVRTIEQAKITKAQKIIEAEQEKETEEIIKDQKKLEGEGDRLKAEEVAKGLAAPIREKGLAEAEAKEKLQAALNKFGDKAIRALVAEKVVEKDKAVGVAMASALEKSDMKVFAGGGDSAGFDFGKMMSSMAVADSTSADAMFNKVARPNDLGMTALALKSLKEEKDEVKKAKQVNTETETKGVKK